MYIGEEDKAVVALVEQYNELVSVTRVDIKGSK